MCKKIITGAAFLILLLGVMCLTGCIERLSAEDLPDEQEILRYADVHCPEPHTLISSEKVDGKAEIIYYFETDRGLEFTIKSFVSQGFLTDDTTAIRSSYMNSVRAFYEGETKQILETYLSEDNLSDINTYSYLPLNVYSYEELEAVSQAVDTLNELWDEELGYVRHDFPLAEVSIRWKQVGTEEPQNSKTVEIAQMQIRGTQFGKDVLEDLQESYLFLYEEGEIVDSEEQSKDYYKETE